MKNKKIFSIALISAMLLGVTAFADGEGVPEGEVSSDVEQEDTVVEGDSSDLNHVEFIDEATVEETSETEEIVSADEIIEDEYIPEDVVDEEVVDENAPFVLTEDVVSNDVIVEETITEEEETEVTEEPVIVNLYDFETVSYAATEVAVTYYLMDAYNVRTIADPNAEVLATLDKGAAVSVVGTPIESSPWIKVSVDGQIGYINTFYLSAEPIDVSNDYSADLKSDLEAEDTYAQWAFN